MDDLCTQNAGCKTFCQQAGVKCKTPTHGEMAKRWTDETGTGSKDRRRTPEWSLQGLKRTRRGKCKIEIKMEMRTEESQIKEGYLRSSLALSSYYNYNIQDDTCLNKKKFWKRIKEVTTLQKSLIEKLWRPTNVPRCPICLGAHGTSCGRHFKMLQVADTSS